MGIALIVLVTFVIGGIAYTYMHRPLLNAATHLLERHKVPSDL